jgi:signal transduction histidine kinase
MQSRRTRVFVAMILAGVCWLGATADAWAGPAQKRVLAIYSTRRETQFAALGDRELPRLLAAKAGAVDFYSEYIDLPRFPDPAYQTAVRDYLLLKYRDHPIDVVIALQDVATQFVEQFRAEVFPDAGIVFVATRPPVLPQSTAVRLDTDLTRSISLAVALQPDIEQVFVVSGASSRDRYYEGIARTQFAPLARRLKFTYLSGLPAAELEGRLSMLPERSIVYYLLFYQDGLGVNVEPLEYLPRLTTIANRPTYSWTDGAMGRGIVGGVLRSAELQLEAAAAQASRLLAGERTDGIPVSTPDLYVGQVDWRQIERWNIRSARIPAGTTIRFREPGAWERYKIYILGGAAVIAVQTMLIAGLVIQRAYRRKAEEQVRRAEEDLRVSYDRIHDLGGRLLVAQEAERARIARELHEDISPLMALVALDLEMLRGASNRDPAAADTAAAVTIERVNAITKALHALSNRLHPPKLRLIGLVPALAGLAREYSTGNTTVIFNSWGLPDVVPHDVTLCFYRVAQEALRNAVTHGTATNISMHVDGLPDRIRLVIVDDGIGFDVTARIGHGLGLASMRERVEAFHGRLKVDSRPGVGTRIEARLPVDLDNPEKAVRTSA